MQFGSLMCISAARCRLLNVIWAVMMPTALRNYEC